MTKKILFFIFINIFSLSSICAESAKTKLLPLPKEEKLSYEIKLGQLYLGNAEFVYEGQVKIDNEVLNFMTFEAQTLNFLDKEKIYSHPESLLPIRIEREVVTLFKKEEIKEDYDQKKFILTILKKNGNNEEKMSIKKNAPIHNAILFPHYLRRIPNLKIGSIFNINLPNRQLKLKLVSIDKIRLFQKTFTAFYFKSTNNEIKIWISTDQRRLPLKIEANAGFGYSLVLKEYSS